jgi:hypothetical protein
MKPEIVLRQPELSAVADGSDEQLQLVEDASLTE